jgi:hypothetical protein
MQFTIDVANAIMTINGVGETIAVTGLPANISYVRFSDSDGGVILYNDRPALPAPFSDPSPYQSYFNAWITAAAAGSPALLLSQAQSLKAALVNSIYAMKRQLPCSVAVSAGTYPWDASDPAVARMALLAGLLYVDPLNTVISAGPGGGLTQLMVDLNTMVANLNVWASHFNTLNSNMTTFNGNVASAINTWIGALQTTEGGGNIIGWANPGSYSAPASPATTADTALGTFAETFSNVSAIKVPTIQLIPVGSSSPITLTPTDLQKVVIAMAAQNTKYQATSASKQAAVNALSTIAAVAAYDATAGW